ncbi:hypothetical protein N0V90_011893 [Kalmusia sp. IMI 367209]|nr:hypothetical protein N0V90_011893 [Kalmusia sp. IMI 367209]
MASPYDLSEATADDAPSIAALYSLSWKSDFARLQFGDLDPTALATSLTPGLAETITKDDVQVIVARDPSTREVVAVAQWKLPADASAESPEAREERQRFEDEIHRNKLPDTSNKDLIMDFHIGLRTLRERLTEGQKYFSTHPELRGKGIGSRLIAWPFAQADEQQALVYLETAADNPAKRLYQKLGFEEKDSFTILDLSRYGGEGSHTHIALIRYPRRV